MIGFDPVGGAATAGTEEAPLVRVSTYLTGSFAVCTRLRQQLTGSHAVRSRVRQTLTGGLALHQRVRQVLSGSVAISNRPPIIRTLSGVFQVRRRVRTSVEGTMTVQSLNGPKVAESRTLRWPVGPTLPAQIGNYRQASGRYVIGKDPDAVLVYVIDLVDWLADAQTSLQSVSVPVVRGVEAAGDAFIEGTCVAVLCRGLSLLDGAPNYCTFHFTCVDGQEADATIYFEQEET